MPILFSGPMVKAILDGRKTQTRRVVKLPPWAQDPPETDGKTVEAVCRHTGCMAGIPCPCGTVGDRLYVRETWTRALASEIPAGRPSSPAPGGVGLLPGEPLLGGRYRDPLRIIYRADGEFPLGLTGSWHPSIHMPKWAARLWLDVLGIRVERLQDITEEDARAEGCGVVCTHPNPVLPDACEDCMNTGYSYPPLLEFREIWDATYGAGAWDRNEWVWVLTFRRVER